MVIIRPENALKKFYIDIGDLGKGPLLGFSPHDDDVLLGCGGLFYLAYKNGIHTYVAVVTDGSEGYWNLGGRESIPEQRRMETINAYGRIGVPEDNVIFLGLPDRELEKNQKETENEFIRVIRKVRPGTVFEPKGSDKHIDHFYTNLLCNSAVFCHAREPLYSELGEPAEVGKVFEYGTRGREFKTAQYKSLIEKIEKIGGMNEEVYLGLLDHINEITGFNKIRHLRLSGEVQEMKKQALCEFESQKKLIKGLKDDFETGWEIEEYRLVT